MSDDEVMDLTRARASTASIDSLRADLLSSLVAETTSACDRTNASAEDDGVAALAALAAAFAEHLALRVRAAAVHAGRIQIRPADVVLSCANPLLRSAVETCVSDGGSVAAAIAVREAQGDAGPTRRTAAAESALLLASYDAAIAAASAAGAVLADDAAHLLGEAVLAFAGRLCRRSRLAAQHANRTVLVTAADVRFSAGPIAVAACMQPP